MPYYSARRATFAVVAFLFLAVSSPSNAVEFNVDTTADYIDKNVGDGICAAEITGIYKCTLRAALQEANARVGLDRINVPAGLFLITQGGPTDDTGAQGDLDVLDDLELIGSGSASTIIDGNNIDRVIHVPADAAQVIQVVMRGMTIQHGFPQAPTVALQSGGGISNAELLLLDDIVLTLNGAASGGGLFNTGTLIAQNLAVNNNSATQGGGVAASSGETYLVDAQISNNRATSNGAGIYQSAGTVELSRATITSNATSGGGSLGAGIHTTGTLAVYDSTIQANSSAGNGGALSVTSSGVAKLYGSLVAANTAVVKGGGIYVDAQLIAVNTTISGNAAADGGGIYQGVPANSSISRTDGTNLTLAFNSAPVGANAHKIEGLFNIQNSIVSNPVTGTNCAGVIDSLGYNIDSGTSCALKAVGDRSDVDPKLSVLATNGGATQTHALAADSPAIDTGAATVCPSNDQRSYRRGDALCDVGAYEANSVPTTSGVLKLDKASYSVNESEKTLQVTVLRTGGSDGLVTVKYFVRTGTAKAGVDFAKTEGQLLWTDGDSTPKLITIPITDDTAKEPVDELATVSIVSPVGGATLGAPNTATIAIADNDWKPGSLEFTDNNYAAMENGGAAQITIKRVGGSDGEVSVDYASSNGTAIVGQDYAAASGKLTLGSGVTTATFSVLIIDDTTYEAGETINLTLSNPTNGATLAPLTSATVTIVENDPRKAGQLQFAVSGFSIPESSVPVSIAVTRVNGTDGVVSVDFGLFQYSAELNEDFKGGSGSLTFADGEDHKIVVFELIDDTIYEGDETITLQLLNPSGGASIGDPSKATFTIVENEIPQPGTIQFESANHVVSEGTVALDLKVIRINGQDGDSTVNYTVTGGTATLGTDFTFGTGVLNFTQGKTSANIQILLKNDTTFDPDETIVITLSPPTGSASLGSVSSATVTIVDDDTAVSSTGTANGEGSSAAPAADSKNTTKKAGGGALSALQLLAWGFFLLCIRRSRIRRAVAR